MSGPVDSLGSVGHEQVVFCHDPETGLRSIIAIHSTALGPGLGGIRMAPYPSVVLADVNAARAEALASRLGARAVAAADILFTPCDMLVPSAVGGVINDQTVDALRCRAVVAAANNALDRPDHGERLRERGILYGVDFVANSGGIIFLEAERLRLSPSETEQRIKTVGTILRRVYDRAEADAISTDRAAELIAEERLAAAATVRPLLVAPGERKYAR